jgi:hypothetical protein
MKKKKRGIKEAKKPKTQASTREGDNYQYCNTAEKKQTKEDQHSLRKGEDPLVRISAC